MKKFIIKTFLLGCPIFIVIAFPNIFKVKTSGDLGALGLVQFDPSYRNNVEVHKVTISETLYCKSVAELQKYNVDDVLVIGDSHAHQPVGFQDYLSEKTNNSIMTLHHNLDIEASDIFITLLSKRRDLVPKLVIVESGERVFVRRLAKMQIDTILEIDSIYYAPKFDSKGYIEMAQNFYKIKLGLNNPINHVMLNKDLFTCKDKERELYFYPGDIFKSTLSDVEVAIENLEMLHNLALQQGVYLIYMVVADKYDIYQKFIVDNPYQPNDLLSKGNSFDNLPYFINTKYVLTEAAENGVKDIYWADDTHLSPVGAKMVADEIARRLDSLGVLQK